MAVTVTYNGLAPWVDDTPFVSIQKEPLYVGSGKVAEVHNITLDGKITSDTLFHGPGGGPGSLPGRIYAGTLGAGGLQNNIEDVKNDIINLFSNNWGSLIVMDVSGNQVIGPLNPINNGHNIAVENLDFESSQWIGAVGYSINLKSYPSDYFEDMGIVDKVDEYSISQNEDEMYTITHRIQARGVNAAAAGPAANALDNAIDFVNARRGYNWASSALPISNPILLSETENINRLEATYEVTENWVEDGTDTTLPGAAGVHIRISVGVEESEFDNDFDQATINVQYTGGVNTTYATLRNEVMSDAALHVHCQNAFDPTMIKLLASLPVGGISIEENMADKEINQRATFDTNSLFTATPNAGLVFFDYNVSLSYDNIMGITSVNVEGDLKTKGPANYREFSINDFLTNTAISTHLYVIANTAYGSGSYTNGSNWAGGGAFVLNWDPKTINVTKNVEKMSCKISATFDDVDFIPAFEEASWSANVTAPSYIRNANPSATYNAHYALTDLGIYSRQKHTTKVELVYRENKKFPISVSPPFGIPGTWTSAETIMQWQAWNTAWAVDSLFPQSVVPDSYQVTETQTVGKADKEALGFSRTRNYCTNNPLIGFPPDPLVGFASSDGVRVGLNLLGTLLPCPPPPATTTLPPLSTTPTTGTTAPPSTSTTGTTIPPIGGTTTNPPWCPGIPAWSSSGAPYSYGVRVCHAPTTGTGSPVGVPVCWVCSKFCASGSGVGTAPCPCPSEPGSSGAGADWIHYCPDAGNCPEGGGTAMDCCCEGPCPQCPGSSPD